MYMLVVMSVLFLFGTNSRATEINNSPYLIEAATRYLKSLPDINSDAQFKITIPLAAQKPNHCHDLKFSLLSKNNQGSFIRLNVLCDDADSWHSIFNVYRINPIKYYVAAHDLQQGKVVSDSDIAVLYDGKALLSTAIIANKEKILGLTLIHDIQKGNTFLRSDLKPVRGLMMGQSIKIISRGNGFQITSQGKLLNNPTNGQFARVETSSKKLVTGIVEGTSVVDILN
ncbi:MAG: flagellar basal body P-ring formation chaperone FlgA [Methylococcaceae bacterium]